jgi:hypothetical protein
MAISAKSVALIAIMVLIGCLMLSRDSHRHTIDLEGHAIVNTSATATLGVYEAIASVTPGGKHFTYMMIETELSKVQDGVLYAWAMDHEPVGPRIEASGLQLEGVPESTIKSLANLELQRRDKERTQLNIAARTTQEAAEKRWDLLMSNLKAVVSWIGGMITTWGIPRLMRWWDRYQEKRRATVIVPEIRQRRRS